MDDVPEVPILLLGDPGVGKSTFISRLTLGARAASDQPLPVLRDLDQPFPFDISMYRRPYRFEFYDTACPTNYTLLRPAVLILCYSIADPTSLESLKTKWKEVIEIHFNQNEDIPVIVLGLKRDVRKQEDYDGRVVHGRGIVYAHTALRVSQEMRCDRYCECSAMTGDLCQETFEDIAKTAALTTTAKGGRSDGPQCTLM